MMRSARHTCGTRRDLVIAAAALAATLAAGCTFGNPSAFNGIDVSGADYGKDFRLLDPERRSRTLADFKGLAVLLFLGFTQCSDVCSTALARAAQAKALLGDLGSRVPVIFVTVDPERDTAQVPQAYTTAFDPSDWCRPRPRRRRWSKSTRWPCRTTSCACARCRRWSCRPARPSSSSPAATTSC